MKNLLIKLGLWEETWETDIGEKILVDLAWWKEAIKHYCGPCNRWFADTRGKMMHDRWKHKQPQK